MFIRWQEMKRAATNTKRLLICACFTDLGRYFIYPCVCFINTSQQVINLCIFYIHCLYFYTVWVHFINPNTDFTNVLVLEADDGWMLFRSVIQISMINCTAGPDGFINLMHCGCCWSDGTQRCIHMNTECLSSCIFVRTKLEF